MSFNKGIYKVIEKMEHDMYLVKTIKTIKCSCIHPDTKQPKIECKKCLGTGHKIKIKKIRAAHDESDISSARRSSSNTSIDRYFYIKHFYDVQKEDLIVDENEVYTVYKNERLTAFAGEELYDRCLCPITKAKHDIVLQNFKEIMKRWVDC